MEEELKEQFTQLSVHTPPILRQEVQGWSHPHYVACSAAAAEVQGIQLEAEEGEAVAVGHHPLGGQWVGQGLAQGVAILHTLSSCLCEELHQSMGQQLFAVPGLQVHQDDCVGEGSGGETMAATEGLDLVEAVLEQPQVRWAELGRGEGVGG